MLFNLTSGTGWFLLCLLAGKGLLEFWRLLQSISWLKQTTYQSIGASVLPEVYIIIPVLREQRVLEQMISHFLALDYPADKFKLIIVTTNKEKFELKKQRRRLGGLTNDLAKGLSQSVIVSKYLGIFSLNELKNLCLNFSHHPIDQIAKVVMTQFDNKELTYEQALRLRQGSFARQHHQIKIFNYPRHSGVMAHQINYAVSQLPRLSSNITRLIGIYNADSIPHQQTLRAVASLSMKYVDQDFALQQSSFFLHNLSEITKPLVQAGGVFQSQWTLSHEIPRIRRQAKTTKSRLPKLAHCVGHGMFIRQDLFEQLGGLSTTTMNEDLPFGFKLCCRGIPIIPVPLLESADTPETWRSLLNQKRVWFWGCLDYVKCRSQALREQPENSTRINWLTLQGYYYGLSWAMNSILLGGPLLLGLLTHQYYLILSTVCIAWVTISLPQLITLQQGLTADYLPPAQQSLTRQKMLLISLLGIIVFLTDSWGPYLTISDKIRRDLFGYTPLKKKTER